jgi:hypothetical protein
MAPDPWRPFATPERARPHRTWQRIPVTGASRASLATEWFLAGSGEVVHGGRYDEEPDRVYRVEGRRPHRPGPARIGRVTFSKSGATLYYRGKAFRSLKGEGFKANYYDVETGEPYWISGPRRDSRNALYATHVMPEIDEDVREEYLRDIRGTAGGS